MIFKLKKAVQGCQPYYRSTQGAAKKPGSGKSYIDVEGEEVPHTPSGLEATPQTDMYWTTIW